MSSLPHYLNRSILSIFMLCISSYIYAKDNINSVCINFKNGEYAYFMFSSFPRLSFEGNECFVMSSDVDAQYSLDNINSITLTDYVLRKFL